MASSNPRRRQLSVAPPSFLSGSAFQKGATFHGPSSPKSYENDPVLNISTLPVRSSTCARDLEAALAAGQSRISSILGAVERSFSSLESFSNDSQETIIAEPEPVPRFMVNAVNRDISQDAMDIDVPYRKHHTSDSGIGSTETSEASVIQRKSMTRPPIITSNDLRKAASATTSHVQIGINGNSTISPFIGSAAQHVLTEYACRQIQKHIILPIVREEKLKPFHSLVQGLPYRVARKEITCLRDLEKVILWLAPVSSYPIPKVNTICNDDHGSEYLLSMLIGKEIVDLAGVLDFIWSFRLILSVRNGHLLESPFFSFARPRSSASTRQSNISAVAISGDQPTDLILTATSSISLNRFDNTQLPCLQKEQGQSPLAKVSTLLTSMFKGWLPRHDSNNTRNDKLTLVGGLSQTGQPAELVRTVDGKSVSLRTGQEINMEEHKTGIKRNFGEEFEDDLERSMARRKKNAIRVDQHCRDCGKAFKRPCDLTKHEKTHSRPWKCDEVGCKYHTYGWPTEKERDRHMNDKHSAAPNMYRCSYPPCPYESKRESNCKQHMEKAHGYVYVRAKNNGKARAPSTVGAPTTPQMSTPGSHTFSAQSPDFSDAQSINESIEDSFDLSGMPTMRYLQEATNFGEIFGPASNDFNFADSPFAYTEAGPSNLHRQSYDSNAVSPSMEEGSIFGNNFDWSNTNLDFTGFHAQIPTPALSHEPTFTSSAPSANLSPTSTCLSPHGHADAMLFSPISHNHNDFNDEGYSELTQGFRPVNDFNLYSNSTSATISPALEMFGELPSYEKNGQLMNTHMDFFEDIM